ncbi:MAG TPA: type VI secretion system tip protein TssI/VgrG [Albitalea sp.]
MPQQPYRIKTPLPASDLLLESLHCTESLSTLSQINASLLSPRGDIDPDKLLGQPVSFELAMSDDGTRRLHGYVTRFTHSGSVGRFHSYQAVVRPWLWFLTRTTDCRIFQSQTVPEMVKTVFEDHGIAVHDFKLFREYRSWDYCVQYRESDFNFVSRLLEHEGIYYRFEHSDGAHKLLLLDSSGAHDPQPHGLESLPYYANNGQAPPGAQYVSRWASSRSVRPGKFAITDYDFAKPQSKLLAQGARERGHELSDAEVFDFPGGYTRLADGTQYLENRIDEFHSRFEVFDGATNAIGLQLGFTFKLERHPRDEENAEYLVTSTTLQAHNGNLEAGAGSAGGFHCEFSALRTGQQFRPPRRSPKPFMQGPQTAKVVGPAGDEIYTDKHGRVKVQFHWDRYGRDDENSSCWIRVSHPWAGKGWGAVSIPRIGQEVVVDFLEGDPDQPIITGRVYNAENMAPYPLPEGAVVSGMKSNTHKGSGYNEISANDTAGAEMITIHGQYDMSTTVLHDQTLEVGNNRTDHIAVDDSETVDNNQTLVVGVDQDITVGSNRSESVGANETITIGADRTETVGANQSVSIGGSDTLTVALQRTHAVGVNETIAIGAAQEIAIGALQAVVIGASQTVTVGGPQTVSVGAAQTVSVGAGQTVTVAANQAESVGGNRAVKVGGKLATNVGGDAGMTVGGGRSASVANDDSFSIGKKFVVDAGDEISLTTGSASIVMKKDGSITIKGKDIKIEGSGKVNVKASGDVIIKGAKVTAN